MEGQVLRVVIGVMPIDWLNLPVQGFIRKSPNVGKGAIAFPLPYKKAPKSLALYRNARDLIAILSGLTHFVRRLGSFG
jgi:hypothetical protein